MARRWSHCPRRIDRELAGQAQTVVNVMEEEFQEQSPIALRVDGGAPAVAQRERAFAVFDDKGAAIAERLSGLQLKLPDLPMVR